MDTKSPRSGAKPRSATAITFYRQCRLWHGYLSAVAFLALIFFSATGILLNHPDWLAHEPPEPAMQTVQLAQDELSAALKEKDKGPALAAVVLRKVSLRGTYTSADIDNAQALLRFEGIKGSSDVTIDLKTASAEVSVQSSDAATMLDDLHRGKNAGPLWRALIDISGALMLALSLIGYVLFFSMRFRLRTSLILTGVSLALLVEIFVLAVP